MLWSRSLIPTMKETPEGAEIPSHILMLRAGLINQVMAGAYTYLPLGLRALRRPSRSSAAAWTRPVPSKSSCPRSRPSACSSRADGSTPLATCSSS